jgi:hypothetical protein
MRTAKSFKQAFLSTHHCIWFCCHHPFFKLPTLTHVETWFVHMSMQFTCDLGHNLHDQQTPTRFKVLGYVELLSCCIKSGLDDKGGSLNLGTPCGCLRQECSIDRKIGWRLKGLNLPLCKAITILISWNNYLKKTQ